MKLKWWPIKPFFDIYCFFCCGTAGYMIGQGLIVPGISLFVVSISSQFYGTYLAYKEDRQDLLDYAREIFSK